MGLMKRKMCPFVEIGGPGADPAPSVSATSLGGRVARDALQNAVRLLPSELERERGAVLMHLGSRRRLLDVPADMGVQPAQVAQPGIVHIDEERIGAVVR